MLTPFNIARCSTRLIRRKPPGGGILDEGVTFSDVHNVILNPTTRLPYPEEQLREHIEKTSSEIMKERNKIRYGTRKKKDSGAIDFSQLPIEEHVVLLFPGQGAQFVGMGQKVMDIPAARRVFDEASEVLGYDMLKVCQDGPKQKLEQTLYCQPAIVTSSIAAFEALKASDPSIEENLTDTAGFSVGEYASLVAGKVLSFSDAIKIVKTRAEAMSECAKLVKSGMVTIRVKAASKLDKAMADARKVAAENRELVVCEVANYLYCGVRVIGGSETCLKYLEENQEKYNIQVMKRLAVSAAFHTRQMESAVEQVAKAFQNVEIHRPVCNVWSNYSGKVMSSKKGDVRGAVAKQINSPVRWEQIQQSLFRKHQNEAFPRFYEVGAGRQLGAMLFQTSKKAHKNYSHFSC
ncbi:[acyl-carrier-protein] S-malonyltransferase [Caenorhabditis elegans]|uniref:[acyl-carrier-protein] S-malonyltransferase n=1 Tax=Caenorhabditis elegans TaxID=6239 RepID=Q8ITY6_CAEEL|nr:Malonyl-CoA:ACP transacylase (MAT) domain-containing protein [Caenorhabditis elegans]CCD65341.2 Malonyl-CoA:ACP transacylase (MAT) domain-containing protein [Caenorhabditis elegans]|eukprot:NP_871954.3 Uncharacterized protein CELE_C50D2.9 [Caenorhabditis elegans]